MKTQLIRKVLISLLLVVAVNFFVVAQGISVKSEQPASYGPEAGSFAVGVCADPFLEYLGNFFGKSVRNNAPGVDFANGFDIFGKYFISDYGAIRAGVSLNYDSETNFFGTDEKDKKIEAETYVGIAVGYEQRIGEGRVQGFWGPSAGIGFYQAADTYKYDKSPDPGTLLKRKYGSSVSLSLGGFCGFEYFLTGNIALGTEFGLGLNLWSDGKGSIEKQGEADTEVGSESKAFSFGFNDVAAQIAPRGAIYLSIYIN